jgi:hypothetical protein
MSVETCIVCGGPCDSRVYDSSFGSICRTCYNQRLNHLSLSLQDWLASHQTPLALARSLLTGWAEMTYPDSDTSELFTIFFPPDSRGITEDNVSTHPRAGDVQKQCETALQRYRERQEANVELECEGCSHRASLA